MTLGNKLYNQCVKWIVFPLHFKTTTYARRYEAAKNGNYRLHHVVLLCELSNGV